MPHERKGDERSRSRDEEKRIENLRARAWIHPIAREAREIPVYSAGDEVLHDPPLGLSLHPPPVEALPEPGPGRRRFPGARRRASTTMYSVVNTVSHHQMSVEDAGRLVVLWATQEEGGAQRRPPDWETVQAVLERGRSFEAFGLFQGGGSPVTLSGAEVEPRLPDARGRERPQGHGCRPAPRPDLPARGLRGHGRPEGSALRRRQLRGLAAPPGRRSRRDRQDDPRGRRAPGGDRGHAPRLSPRPVRRRHRVLGRPRPPSHTPGARDDRGRTPEARDHAGRGPGRSHGHRTAGPGEPRPEARQDGSPRGAA